ncbi:hypothetical protein OEA41_000456 [Lepraria neglecta]|uniref:Uncharacterized protein n=1 Tax=Lepraria neglecta TaxID=209136 RepID=A0AAD9ZGL4_9LECA|nr:hypothetical protein OEA41_000456 [Lepraria neglecta]
MDDSIIYTSGFDDDKCDAHRDLFVEFNDDGCNPRTPQACTPAPDNAAMEDTFIYTSGFEDDQNDPNRDMFGEFNDDGYNPHNDVLPALYPSSSARTVHEAINSSTFERLSEVNKSRLDSIQQHLYKPTGSLPKLSASFPSSAITSPTSSESSSSGWLSVPPSNVPEDCPCKCGGFDRSCYLLTLPPSPLHYTVKCSDGELERHMFLDARQFEENQKSDLEMIMYDLDDRLERWRKTRSPPRSLLPWSGPKTPTVKHDDYTIGVMYIGDLVGKAGNAGVSTSPPETLDHLSVPASPTLHEQLSRSYNPLSQGQRKVQGDPTETARILATIMSKAAAAYPTPESSSTTTPHFQQRLHNGPMGGSSRKRGREDDEDDENDEDQRQLWPKRRC